MLTASFPSFYFPLKLLMALQKMPNVVLLLMFLLKMPSSHMLLMALLKMPHVMWC